VEVLLHLPTDSQGLPLIRKIILSDMQVGRKQQKTAESKGIECVTARVGQDHGIGTYLLKGGIRI